MKKIFLALAIASLAFTGAAGNFDEKPKTDPDKYCAEFKDGLLKVVHDGVELNADVKLDNGTIIHTDATVQKKDGTVTVLKPGECVNLEGKLDNEPTGKEAGKTPKGGKK